MAQLIQHKRGVLEDLSGVTPNKGELLVVTGSSISALADGLVFVGNHSDLTSVNKILTGSSSPDLSSYDVGVNGLPFYNTTDKNLQILRQDGNIDIVLKHNKVDFGGSTILSGSMVSPNNNAITLAVGGGLSVSADADFTLNQNSDQTITISTDGSNIVSGSSQTIAHLGGSGIISSSAQIDSDFFDIDGLVSSSAQVQAYGVFAELNGDNLVSSSAQIDALGFLKVDGDNVISSSAQLTGTFLEINGDNVISSSAQLTGTFLEINGDNVISGSSQVNADSITNFDSNVKDKLNTEGVISSSAQLADDFLDQFGEGTFSGSSQVDHDQTTNFVANEHIDHTSVSITAGDGLSGGGNISSTRTLTLDTGSNHFNNGVKAKLDDGNVISGSSQVVLQNADKTYFCPIFF